MIFFGLKRERKGQIWLIRGFHCKLVIEGGFGLFKLEFNNTALREIWL